MFVKLKQEAETKVVKESLAHQVRICTQQTYDPARELRMCAHQIP